MKYFTREWWAADCPEAESVFRKYNSYLASVRSALPERLVELDSQHTLHDSELKHVRCNFEDRTVEWVLHGWDRELKHKVRYRLAFAGVIEFEQQLPLQEYVEEELGDIGYWECEMQEKDIEVRVLFISGAEFRVVFANFNFSYERYTA
jgi:hypothetical protein